MIKQILAVVIVATFMSCGQFKSGKNIQEQKPTDQPSTTGQPVVANPEPGSAEVMPEQNEKGQQPDESKIALEVTLTPSSANKSSGTSVVTAGQVTLLSDSDFSDSEIGSQVEDAVELATIESGVEQGASGSTFFLTGEEQAEGTATAEESMENEVPVSALPIMKVNPGNYPQFNWLFKNRPNFKKFPQKLVTKRVCEANEAAGTAIVNIEKSGAKESKRVMGVHEFEVLKAGSESIIRTWSKEDQQVQCSEDGKFAAVEQKHRGGYNLTIEFTKNFSKARSHTNNKNGHQQLRSKDVQASGHANLTFSQVGVDETSVINQTTITAEKTRNVVLSKKEGEEIAFTSTRSIASENPLIIEVVRDVDAKTWRSRTIQSGTITDTHKNSQVITSFDQVTITKEGNCKKVSGTITGIITKLDNGNIKSFTITYAADLGKIVYSDGTQKEFIIDLCHD